MQNPTEITTPLQVYKLLIEEFVDPLELLNQAGVSKDNPYFDTIKSNYEFAYFAKYLEYVTMLSFNNTEEALSMLSLKNSIISILPDNLLRLRDAAMHQCLRRAETSERTVQSKFFNNLDTYLPGAEKVSVKMCKEHIPDGFVSYGGSVWPVEVKYKDFNCRALMQLKRYMNHYGATNGVAVAQNLACPMPDNVIFVKVDLN